MANFDKVILNGTTYTIPSGGGGGTVDTQLSPSSTNAVQNKAIYDAVYVVQEYSEIENRIIHSNTLSDGDRFKVEIEDVPYNTYLYLFMPMNGSSSPGLYHRFDLTNLSNYYEVGLDGYDGTYAEDNTKWVYANKLVDCSFDTTTRKFTAEFINRLVDGMWKMWSDSFSAKVGFDDTAYIFDGHALIEDEVSYDYSAPFAIYKKLSSPVATSLKSLVEGLGENELYIPQYWNANSYGSEGNLFLQLNKYNILTGEYDSSSTQTQQLLKYDTNSFKYDNNNGFTFDYKKTVEPDATPDVNITDYDSYSSSESISIYTHDLTLAIDFGNSTGSTTFTLESENNNTYEFMVEKHGGDINVTINSQGMYYYYKSLQFPSTSTTGIITFGNDAPFEELTTFAKSFGDSGVVNAIRIYSEVVVKNLDELFDDKQDTLVSGTNIKTINNQSILGSGNITIQGGGSSYTAGDNIDITNNVISVDIDDEKKVLASALVELHNDKADKNQLNNYQLKGDYQTGEQVDAKITTATSTLRTEEEALNVEKVDAAALTDLNARVSTLEQGGGGSGITGITMNGSAVTVTSGVADLGTVVTDKSDKQDTLVSGTNIKTINNESILGSGNITIQGGGSSYSAGDGIDITSDVITNTREQRVLTFEDSTTGVKAALRVISPHWDENNTETVSDPANDLTFVNNVPAANADPYVQANYLDGTLMEFEITEYSESSSSSFEFAPDSVTGGILYVYVDGEWVYEGYGSIYAKDSFDVGQKFRMNSTMLTALMSAMQADCPYEIMAVEYKTYAWDTNKSVSGVHSGTAYQLAYNSDLTALAARVTALETALGNINTLLAAI